MIHFKCVRYKNLLATGNTFTEIFLDQHKSTLIVGKNGSGKSSVLEAICFGLYSKPFRKINKPQLLNSINQKDLLVEVEFSIEGSNYLVRRGMKPNIFEIFKDEVLINQSSANKDYQLYLEENILKLNYKSFGQIVVLGSSTFVPFMQLTPAARREVIEDLLDIQVFSTMNILVKEKLSKNKAELLDLKYQLDLTKNKLESAKLHNESIAKMKNQEVKSLQSKVEVNQSRILGYDTDIDLLNTEIFSLQQEISDYDSIKENQLKIQDATKQLSFKKKELSTKLDFYSQHDNCPTCKQAIDFEFKQSVTNSSSTKLSEFQEIEQKLISRLNTLSVRLEAIRSTNSEISKLNQKINECKINKDIATRAIKDLEKELETSKLSLKEIDTSKLNEYKTELKMLNTSYESLVDERELITVSASMLKDGGIKTRIIKQYIPVMNKLINQYLTSMDFFVEFQLDESFNERILSRFRDEFSYSSFSEGEKTRIDLSLMFAWRAISKMRNSISTNLLVMDEILDSSLDNAGAEEFIKIINELTSDSNIFIVSHRGGALEDKFEYVLEFEKIKNFSHLKTSL